MDSYTHKEMIELCNEAYENGCMETLRKVFKYGYATETHLNMISFLREKNVSIEQYKEWNRG